MIWQPKESFRRANVIISLFRLKLFPDSLFYIPHLANKTFTIWLPGLSPRPSLPVYCSATGRTFSLTSQDPSVVHRTPSPPLHPVYKPSLRSLPRSQFHWGGFSEYPRHFHQFQAYTSLLLVQHPSHLTESAYLLGFPFMYDEFLEEGAAPCATTLPALCLAHRGHHTYTHWFQKRRQGKMGNWEEYGSSVFLWESGEKETT